jgi:hypothetical protein
MTSARLLNQGWIRAKTHAPGVVAAALMYGGIHQILSAIQYPLSNYVVKLVNLILRQAFRNMMPLTEFGTVPWLYHAKNASVGVIVTVVGMFIGLWVNGRRQHRPAP